MHAERSEKPALAENAFASRVCFIMMPLCGVPWDDPRYKQRHDMPCDALF
jgi:hypothetical protein